MTRAAIIAQGESDSGRWAGIRYRDGMTPGNTGMPNQQGRRSQMFSVLDMFTIGVGPSSSHTVGPMVAAHAFASSLQADHLVDRTARVKITLYGSLALTGLGHGTDRAAMAGLEGNLPATVDTDHMMHIREICALDDTLNLAGLKRIHFDYDRDVVFEQWKRMVSLIPAIYATEFSSLKTDGTATLAASAKGTLQGDTVPAFNIDMQVKNAMFRYPALPAGVDQININANVRNPGGNIDLTTIQINPFSFRLAGNPFSLTADVKTPVSDPDFKAEAKGTLDLGMIKQVYPLGDMELNGTINADMQMSGRLSYIEKEQYDNMKASGTIGLTNMKLKMQDMPDVDIKKSLFTFTPKYLQLSETTVNIGKNDITADSRFENYIGYALKGTTLKGTLNIHSNYFNLNDFMTASTDSVATTEAAATDSTAIAGVIEVPRNIDFQMDANLKQVLFDKMTFNNMNGKLIVKDGKVDMKNLSMGTMSGNVVMNGYYSTANAKKPEMKAGFKLSDISFSQAYKELDMVQQLAPIFENLKGNYVGF